MNCQTVFRRCLWLLAVFAALAIVSGVPRTSTATPFTNGDFQLADIAADTLSATLPVGWSGTSAVKHGDGDPFGHGVAEFVSPEQYVVFNDAGSAAGQTLFQTFDTVISQQYTVTFQVANFFNLGAGGDAIVQAEVFDGTATSGTALGTLTDTRSSATGTGLNASASFNFTALSTSSTLVFTDLSTGVGSIDTGLDNVTLTSVPEPHTLILIMIGILGFGALRRWR